MRKFHVLKINHDTETSIDAVMRGGDVIDARDYNHAADIWAEIHDRIFDQYSYFDLVVMDETKKHIILTVATKCVPVMHLSDVQDLA